MVVLKLGKTKSGQPMHYSVGAVIKKGNKFLLLDRVNPPFGFAGIAGHINQKEDKTKAIIREIEEESGFMAEDCKLLFGEELDWNWCSRGIKAHYWYLFECSVSGDLKKRFEAKSIGWFSPEEMKKLKLEPVWEYWFKKLGVL